LRSPRPPKQTYQGAAHLTEIPLSLLGPLRALARSEGVTLYTLLLAAFYTLLHAYTQQDDIVVGSPMACRSEMEREDCVGYYVNPLPLRSNLEGNPPFRTYLSRVRYERDADTDAHADC
jgi:non-ribosomal peptide synthetase component F